MKTLYLASRVHTLSTQGIGDWILVDERHIERVGAGGPPEADRTVDLPGAAILPGFLDAHVHLSGTGLADEGLDLSGAASREELLSTVRAYLAEHPGWALGIGFDESRWPDRAFPTLAELDEVAGDRVLVLVRTDGYVSLANTAALQRSNAIALDLEGIEPDEEGRPSGVIRREANAHIQRWWFDSLDDARIEGAQLRAAALAASRGVTCVHEMAIPDKRGRRDVEILLSHRDDLPIEVLVYIAERDIPYVMDHRLPRIGGDLFLDGSLGARTAALSSSYEDGEGTGDLAYEDDEVASFFHAAHLAGLQVGVHAIGDAAIEQALRAWERVYGSLDSRSRRHFRARRHRIEHFEMASYGQIEQAAALGLAISIQPGFDAAWGGRGQMYEHRLGRERAWQMNAFRTFVTRGLEVGAGSDSPVTPLDPLHGIWALENHHDPTQRMSREEAIRLYTVGAARLALLEKKGSLEPGMAADFAVYDADPMEEPDVRGLRPILTVSRGREVFAR